LSTISPSTHEQTFNSVIVSPHSFDIGVLHRDAKRRASSASLTTGIAENPVSSPIEPQGESSEVRHTRAASSEREGASASIRSANWRPPPPFEIFRAIEKKDLMFLMEVRDRAFHVRRVFLQILLIV
jgi:hypothetical protein